MRPRVAGTEGEREAALRLASELEKLGLEPRLEEFTLLKGEGEARLWADGREFPASPWELTGSGEFEGPLNLGGEPPLKGQVVLTHDYVRAPRVVRWRKEGALGFVWVRSPKGEVRRPVLAEEAARRWRLLPGVAVDWEVGLEIRWAKRVRVLKTEEIREARSQNVVAVLEGKKYPERLVVFTAHYDSVPESPGGVDNLGGTLALLGIARHLVERPPEKTAILCFCGAEERGLLGSKAFVRAHRELLEKTLLVVNLDVMGDPLGVLGARVLAGRDAARFARSLGITKVSQGIYSSDGMPFALEGRIPSVSLFTAGPSNFWGHTPEDKHVSLRALEEVQPTLNRLASEVLKGEGLPFEPEIPSRLLREVRRYFRERGVV